MPPDWYVTKDGDLSCLELYERHYSCYDYRDGRKRSQFVGPGEHIVLRTGDADAMFVWRKFIDDSGQQGVNCAVFRNEGRILSSELVRQLTPLLISAGLVKGTTHTSIRKQSGAPIRASALWPLDGDGAE
jgi:hypothetical protein